MRAQCKCSVIGVLVDSVDYATATARVLMAARQGVSYTVTALAAHGVVEASRDPRLRTLINSFDLVTPDGQPVRWAMNAVHGTGLSDRVYGPDLTLCVLGQCLAEGLPVFFYGSHQDVLNALTARMAARFPGLKIAGSMPSQFGLVDSAGLDEISKSIRESGARLCFVGLGCPRQEIFVGSIADRLSMPTLAVGAAFDFHAGRLTQAPHLMRRWGLEWLFRLVKEPRRLWRRYLDTNSAFVLGVYRQLRGRRRYLREKPTWFADEVSA